MGLIADFLRCNGGLPFLFVLSMVVFFHELGHFLVARWCGVQVLVFSIGFGPELFGFNDRTGTRWKISAVPLGGYVKFLGDENAASVPDAAAVETMSPAERKNSFFHKPVGARSAVVAAGPFANFLFSIVVLAGITWMYGEQTYTPSPRVDAVTPGGAADVAGFKPGDVVQSIDGQAIHTFADMQRIVGSAAGRTLQVVVDRGGKPTTLTVAPTRTKGLVLFGYELTEGQVLLGISHTKATADEISTQAVGPLEAIRYGADRTWSVISTTLSYIGGILVRLQAPDQIGGPLQIAQVSCQAASQGFIALMGLAAFLSTSVGLLNLFPIPLLDGGHLLFYGIEAIRGRPLSMRAQEVGFGIGLAIVVMLMLVATWNDFVKIISSAT
jgi:regulator of sigma E protease